MVCGMVLYGVIWYMVSHNMVYGIVRYVEWHGHTKLTISYH